MASVDVPVALLGYGTVGSAVDRLLTEGGRRGRARDGPPLLGELRTTPPAGALGTTISGSGPTVIVWAREEAAGECRGELAERFPDARVLSLAVADGGASAAFG